METTRKPLTEVTYNPMDHKVTIRIRDSGVEVVLRLNDAVYLGTQLCNLV